MQWINLRIYDTIYLSTTKAWLHFVLTKAPPYWNVTLLQSNKTPPMIVLHVVTLMNIPVASLPGLLAAPLPDREADRFCRSMLPLQGIPSFLMMSSKHTYILRLLHSRSIALTMIDQASPWEANPTWHVVICQPLRIPVQRGKAFY
jgi:hypothetical protein